MSTAPTTAWLEAAGVRVHAATWGDADAAGATPFVCVHGLGGSHLNWSLLGPRLAAHGPVWAIDLPGFGLSAPVKGAADIDTAARMLGDIIASAVPGGRAIVVGNSLGALLAITLAARRPDVVIGVVLVGPALPRTGRQVVAPLLLLDLAMVLVPGVGPAWLRLRRSCLPVERQVRLATRLMFADPAAVDPGVIGAHVELAARRRTIPHADRAFVEASRSVVRRLTIGRRVVWSDLAAVRAPVLLIQGSRDRITRPGGAEHVARRRPDWSFRVHDDLGHVPMLEAPERIARDIVDWLPG